MPMETRDPGPAWMCELSASTHDGWADPSRRADPV